MGIRPSLYMIIGINDAKENDPRHVRNVDVYEDVKVERFSLPDELNVDARQYLSHSSTEQYGDLLLDNFIYNHDAESEYRAPGVVGYILDKLPYAADIVYELVQIINCDEESKFRNHGHIVRGNSPSLVSALNHPHSLRRRRDGNDAWDLALKENRAINFEDPYITSTWFSVAVEIMRQAGWEVTRDMLKIMIVWNWS